MCQPQFVRSTTFHWTLAVAGVLAAFVILALVATALFRLFSGALGNAAAAEDWSRAVLTAESRLAAAASAQPALTAPREVADC